MTYSDFSKSIILNIKSIMGYRDVSQKELSEKIGVSKQTISDRFTAKVDKLSVKNLLEYSDALGFELSITFKVNDDISFTANYAPNSDIKKE